MSTAIVGSGEDGEEGAASEPLETVHDTLVSSQNIGDFVVLQECLHSVWSEFDDVSSSVWISHEIGLDTKLTIAISGVTPEDVDHKLLLNR